MNITVKRTLLACTIATTPLMADAVELEDYLVANSSYDDAFVAGSVNAVEPSGDNPDEQIGYNYSINADYQKVFSTLPRSWSYTVGFNANGNRSSSSTETMDNPDFDPANPTAAPAQITVDTESNNDWQISLEGVVDNYFHQSQYPLAFWFGQGIYRSQDSLPDDELAATVGVGYGRVYNATPLAKVIRIVEELNEEGLLTGPIPDSVALEAAEIIDREDEFISRFGKDEYKPDFYAAIEGALARSGALLDGKFGALGALTADEVLEDEPISNRRHGWVVRVGVGFQASDLSGLADNDPKLLAQWEYAKPFGYKGQFINLFSFEPVFGNETLTSFRNEMSYTYELTDLIDWINTWDLTYTRGDDENGDSLETTNHIITSRYSFDIGNTLDYFVGLRLNQTDIDPNEPGSFGDSPEIQFESGFNYRLK